MLKSRIRNDEWKYDDSLKEDLEKYVAKRWRLADIKCFVGRDYPQYAWSLPTLKRRLSHFNIRMIDNSIGPEQIGEVIGNEILNAGGDLGFRAMTAKLRTKHNLKVKEKDVLKALHDIDPQGVQRRGNVGMKKKKARKETFVSLGSNWTWSLDGHDKMAGAEKNKFPLAIYGAYDTFSGFVLYLKVWTTNNDPRVIGKFYLDYIYERQIIPHFIRVDGGTETGTMATIHAFLRSQQRQSTDDDELKADDTVLYGPSTQNKIERWWRELHERLEQPFKKQLAKLCETGKYNSNDDYDKGILAYVFIPIVQRELDDFREIVWNENKGRKQPKKALPNGKASRRM